VHVFYHRDVGALRGRGPLQMANAAVSVSVESQEWAANFYATGGASTTELHNDDELEDWEAADLKAQWTSTPPNVPNVTSGGLEVRDHDVNPSGAQMLEARVHNNGDAARMFGVPGALLEFSAPGSSLTYQNIAEVFTMFVRACLAINYLEPMEQALSDLMTRPTAARFNVEGFYRADAKTRWEIYDIATRVIGPDEAAQLAREREGLAPGDVEFRAIPPAPPSAVPTSLPVAAGGVRCVGMRMLRGRLEPCGRKLADAGQPFTGRCPRCKKEYRAAIVA
jgi:phage portal protein BeeE